MIGSSFPLSQVLQGKGPLFIYFFQVDTVHISLNNNLSDFNIFLPFYHNYPPINLIIIYLVYFSI